MERKTNKVWGLIRRVDGLPSTRSTMCVTSAPIERVDGTHVLKSLAQRWSHPPYAFRASIAMG